MNVTAEIGTPKTLRAILGYPVESLLRRRIQNVVALERLKSRGFPASRVVWRRVIRRRLVWFMLRCRQHTESLAQRACRIIAHNFKVSGVCLKVVNAVAGGARPPVGKRNYPPNLQSIAD